MKKAIAVVIAVIIIVFALLYWKPSAMNTVPESPSSQQAAVADNTLSIERDLQAIGVDDTGGDFSDINKDIESL